MTLEENFKYLMFVGCGRSGSTVAGQLLNAHPNFLISNELRILQNCIGGNKLIRQELNNLIKRATYEFDQDLENSVFHSQTLNRWQKDWKNIATSAKELNLNKEKIMFLGDKKQGGNSKLFKTRRSDCLRVLDGISWVPISTIRSPSQILISYSKISENLEKSCQEFVSDMLTGIKLVQERGGIFINYERLAESPSSYASVLEKKFNIEVNEGWKHLVGNIIQKKEPTIPKREHRDILKRTPDWEELKEKCKELEIDDALI
jgi:hypothetical protein